MRLQNDYRFKWVNNGPSVLEEKWIIDTRGCGYYYKKTDIKRYYKRNYMGLPRITIEKIVEELSKKEDFSDGDLTLQIVCTKCNAAFELNREAIAAAMITNTSIWEYIKFVQHSKCRVCNDNL